MDINLMVFLITVALFGSVVFLGMAIADLEKQMRADREQFARILSIVSGVNTHCGHVLELMKGVADMFNKEHDLHDQAVNAMREVENKAAEMRAEFEEMLIDITENRNKMTELTKRLDDFDALKNVSPTLTNSIQTLDDEQLKSTLTECFNRCLKKSMDSNIGSDAYKDAAKEPDADSTTIKIISGPDGHSVVQRVWNFDSINSHAYEEEEKEADGSDFSNQLAAKKIITPENAGEGTMMPDESV